MAVAKEKVFTREKASLFYGCALMYRDIEIKKKYNSEEEEYIVKFLIDSVDEVIEVKLKEKPAPTVKRGDNVDLADFVYTIKARGTGAFGTNVQADLNEIYEATKVIPMNQK